MASEIVEKLRSGDVILFSRYGFNPGSLGIKLTNFFQSGYQERGWTHAGMYIGEGAVIEAYQKEGIVRNKVEEKYLHGSHRLLILRHKNASEEKLKNAVEFCISEEGQKYDDWGLGYFLLFNFIPEQLHFLLNLFSIADRFNDKTKYFCSELVSRGFQEAGAYCFERESYKIMPSDFKNPLLFEEVARVGEPEKENPLKTGLIFILYLAAAVAIMLLSTMIVLCFIGFVVGLVFIALNFITSKMRNKSSNPPSANSSN